MDIKNLNENVIKNRHTKKGLNKLVKDIGLYVYTILRNKYKMNDDERGDFFCTYYPIIPGLITRFEYFGTPFDGYLSNSINWNIKAYRSEKSKDRSFRIASYKEPFYLVGPEIDFTEFPQKPLQISEPARAVLRLEEKEELLSDSIKLRILYIYLIESNYVDERLKEGIIRITGYKRKWLDSCSDKLNAKVESRLDRIRKIRNRKNSAFFKFHILQEKIFFAENKKEKEELREKILILRKKIDKMTTVIAKAPTRPTHKDIADILGTPRGSIDSGIYYFKSSFKELLDTEIVKKSA